MRGEVWDCGDVQWEVIKLADPLRYMVMPSRPELTHSCVETHCAIVDLDHPISDPIAPVGFTVVVGSQQPGWRGTFWMKRIERL